MSVPGPAENTDFSPDEEDKEDFYFDPPAAAAASPPASSAPGNPPPSSWKRPRATVEEVEDEDARWVQDYPEEKEAGVPLEKCKTFFEKYRADQKREGHAPWYPFESKEEWELARWLMTSGLSQKKTDEFLKLKSVREGIDPSFRNNHTFLKYIDSLPTGPDWFCEPFKLVGDELDADGNPKVEIVEMWHRDPLECVRELLGNPSFTKQGYKPLRVFKDIEEGKGYSNQEFSEMWTAEWWWKIQELLPDGATLTPIIISSDKTQLTHFSGDKQAWPVYLSIGNLRKETRRTPSARATVLLGYIPVTKLEIFSKKNRSANAHQLFHNCMRVMLEPLKAVGRDGVKMDCADGFVRMIFPILSAYIADYPEQCLVACCRENSCPRCLVHPRERGEPVNSTLRDPDETLRVLRDRSKGEFPVEFVDQNLRPINPFWADFPHCDIFSCMTPDILHELHNGAFGDHIVKWSTAAVEGKDDEIDHRFRAMTPHPTLRHFKRGISLASQWTGNERKNMEKVFLGVLAKATDPAVQRAVRGILDFIYYAHFEIHCDESLAKLDAAWQAFHSNKSIFKTLKIRKKFNINKIHKIKHYVHAIRSRGTADGFNTENTERLHIDLAKMAYKATNRVTYTQQMTVWLRRQEAVYKFGTYLQWAVPGYVADAQSDPDGSEDDGADTTHSVPGPSENPDDSDDDGELEDAPAAEPSVPIFRVAKTPPFPNLTAASIVADFGATDFLIHLDHFLDSKSITPKLNPAENSTFPVYKRLSLSLPRVAEVSAHNITDTIRAVRAEPVRMSAKGVKPAKAGQFDTVLVRTERPGSDQRPTDGISVARVRVIFRLPEDHGNYPDPLAYVDWYKPLKPPAPDIGMHEISLSSRSLRQNSSIIPIADIFCSCHLIPAFGRSANLTWTSDRVLDQCKKFYLNPYLRHHDFYLFRYLVDLYDSKRAEAQRRARVRHLGRAGL
ncbi:hypothetical protein DFH07DRAFT_758708 [Mycena maculata]|uniref:Uncharacterized protein n=1 Tax=Mycena maculata TaxID=230809 RepID=A0AAD7HPH6_9AGAR|nr:hypothetical protein DFH07DRAFT_758708 [Mycena maculata]